MDFKNEKCDICQKMFRDGDDIVVCPVCGTPTHRSCFEQTGKCPNEEKHASGFEWKKEKAPSDAEETIICPVCGRENKKGSAHCSSCGHPFEQKAPLGQKNSVNDADRESLMGFSRDGDIPELSDVVEARVRAIAPGITAEQRREHLCGHEIGYTASFIGNGAPSYVEKFRKKEHTGKRTFNWAAFLFAPFWFFWRRMHKAGFVYLSFSVFFSLIAYEPAQKYTEVFQNIVSNFQGTLSPEAVASLRSAMLPILAIYLFTFALHLVAGFTADPLYHKYCKRSLDEVDALAEEGDNVTALSYYLRHSSTGILATLLSIAAYYFIPSIIMMLIQ